MRKNTQKIIFNILAVSLFIWSNAYCSVTNLIHQENTSLEWQALNNMVSALYEKGQYESAIMQAKKALELIQSVKGSHALDATKNMDQLALLYKSQAKYQESEAFYLQSLAIKEKVLGIDDLDVAEALENLAVMYQHMRSYGTTKLKFEMLNPGKKINLLLLRSLAIREKKLGVDHIDLVPTLNNLAKMPALIGASDTSIDLYARVLRIVEKTKGSEHLELVAALKNLASAAEFRDKFINDENSHTTQSQVLVKEKIVQADAIFKERYNTARLYERALAIQEKWLGSNHIDLVDTLLHLGKRWGDVEYDAETLQKKDDFIKRAEAIKVHLFKAHYPDILININALPARYSEPYSLMTTAEVEPAYRALSIWEKSLKYSPNLAGAILSLNESGRILAEHRQFYYAESFFKRAFDWGEFVFGVDNLSISSEKSLNFLVNLYLVQGKYEAAELTLQKALNRQEKKMLAIKGDTQNTTIESTRRFIDVLENYALLFTLQGKFDQALPFYKRAIMLYEAKIQPFNSKKQIYFTHRDQFYLTHLFSKTADLYYNLSEYEQALSFYERAFLAAEDASGMSRHNASELNTTVEALSNLALVNKALKRYDSSESLYRRALDMLLASEYNKKTDGYPLEAKHEPKRAQILYSLAELYQEQAQYSEAESLYQEALKIREQIFGAHHPEVAESLKGLAVLSHSQNQIEVAKQFEIRAASIMARNFASNNADLARRLAEIKAFYHSKSSDHEMAFSQIVVAREQIPNQEAINLAISQINLGTSYYYFGTQGYFGRYPQWEQALSILEQYIGNVEKIDDIELTMAFILDYLVLNKTLCDPIDITELSRKPIPDSVADSKKAESFYKRSLAIKARILAENNLSLATTYENMARICAIAVKIPLSVHQSEYSDEEAQLIKQRHKKTLWLQQRAAEIRAGK